MTAGADEIKIQFRLVTTIDDIEVIKLFCKKHEFFYVLYWFGTHYIETPSRYDMKNKGYNTFADVEAAIFLFLEDISAEEIKLANSQNRSMKTD